MKIGGRYYAYTKTCILYLECYWKSHHEVCVATCVVVAAWVVQASWHDGWQQVSLAYWVDYMQQVPVWVAQVTSAL